jgi:hypothetical protein
VREECADPEGSACRVVDKALVALGVPAGQSILSDSAADDSLRVLVGPWDHLRGRDPESDAIDAGPARSGVFVRFDATAAHMTILDAQGRPARVLGPGAGLIAVTRVKDRHPLWYVTGTDSQGVDAAAGALQEAALTDHYALAITPSGLGVTVPLNRIG